MQRTIGRLLISPLGTGLGGHFHPQWWECITHLQSAVVSSRTLSWGGVYGDAGLARPGLALAPVAPLTWPGGRSHRGGSHRGFLH